MSDIGHGSVDAYLIAEQCVESVLPVHTIFLVIKLDRQRLSSSHLTQAIPGRILLLVRVIMPVYPILIHVLRTTTKECTCTGMLLLSRFSRSIITRQQVVEGAEEDECYCECDDEQDCQFDGTGQVPAHGYRRYQGRLWGKRCGFDTIRHGLTIVANVFF